MAFSRKIRQSLTAIVGTNWVKDDSVTLFSYLSDAQSLPSTAAMGVVYPGNRQELVSVVRLLSKQKISFLPRGAGTGLSGGAVPIEQSVIIELGRMNRILDLDPVNRTVKVEPGVVNITISQAARPYGLYFVPDPSSQKACTIGGNVAENSGGPHTLKFGVTVNHVTGLDVVLADGQEISLGGDYFCQPGPDLLGLMVGSEGTFGIVTGIICRLCPLPEETVTMLVIFSSVDSACRGVSAIIRQGIVPAALELLDEVTISAIQAAGSVGFPDGAAAALIVELEDINAGLETQVEDLEKVLREVGYVDLTRAQNSVEREKIWAARKGAFAALGLISPSFYTQDGVIPRSQLPQVIAKILAVGKKHDLRIANVFHAGDGNLHPLILYNDQDAQEIARCHEASDEILRICLESGGSLSGEHGIGMEKSGLMDVVFNADDLANMKLVRQVFNPEELLNPGKIFPTPGRCAEIKRGALPRGVEA